MNYAIEQTFKVKLDESNTIVEVPGLILPNGPYKPLLHFLCIKKLSGYSCKYFSKARQVVRLFYYYSSTQIKLKGTNEKLIFSGFVAALYNGTVLDGEDHSQLYWKGKSLENVRGLLTIFNAFLDFLANNYSISHMNPKYKADSFENYINQCSKNHKNRNNLLGHLKSNNFQVNRNLDFMGKNKLFKISKSTPFPDAYFKDFFNTGLVTSQKACTLRNQLIVLLMHYGGLRVSEAISVWKIDIYKDPINDEQVVVKICHPEEGPAPLGWNNPNGTNNRKSFLFSQYNLAPRSKQNGYNYVGFKSSRVREIRVHWVPSRAAKLFWYKWCEYRWYIKDFNSHPYAFCNFNGKNKGNPFEIENFRSAYRNALSKIGLKANKQAGLSPHAHRHSYGQRLVTLKVPPVMRAKCLHQSSLDSQLVYTDPSDSETYEYLNKIPEDLEFNPNIKTKGWQEILQYGFNDVDPTGLLSGTYPKLRDNSYETNRK